jgi:4Fe-4S ferredoxin
LNAIDGAKLLTEKIKCKHEPGTYTPVIDRNRCEGKAECVTICPVGVFSIETLPKEMRSKLSLRGKLKGFVHKWQQAILVNAECCEACGLCIKVCPEDAITLSQI